MIAEVLGGSNSQGCPLVELCTSRIARNRTGTFCTQFCAHSVRRNSLGSPLNIASHDHLAKAIFLVRSQTIDLDLQYQPRLVERQTRQVVAKS